ncbi:Uncharacterised protein [Legionella steigerwaltii]|uniref:Uncharacterized protein n=1 Tax=Legionella steigerwaltii TaxID=460 RepID=A0A378LFC9_9GAMM|nr:hypothetical protein [Legionella steigerwaltii]KTD79533.1 hypothetical protein Lstg_0749 [Legionella steigerwaltii]STY24582.1 Uncharacterised protein [Legionella steigerwaltii]
MEYYSVLYLLILLLISALVHHFFKKGSCCQAFAGNIVMAIGIVLFDVLPQFQCVTPLLRQLIILELLIIGFYLMCSFVKCSVEGHFNLFTASAINQFGIGTWVAGSSILALLFLQEFPSWYLVIWTFAFCALIIWPIYIIISLINLQRIFSKKIKLHTGNILLLTVSTQALALLTHSLFAPVIPMLISQVLIILGYLFYIIGFILIGRYLLACSKKRLFLGWSNGNSILHGALSISGLASTVTHALDDKIILNTWIFATSLLFLVEGMGLIKMYHRIKIVGFIQGIFVYNLSQWTRIFTLGMYYSFSFALYKQNVYADIIINTVIMNGKYIVLIILLFEVFLFLQDKLSNPDNKNYKT